VSVVVSFEVIQVEKDKGERPAVALGAADLLVEQRLEMPVVEEIRLHVGKGQAAQFLFQQSALDGEYDPVRELLGAVDGLRRKGIALTAAEVQQPDQALHAV